jgi:hypothetical protein
MIVQKYLIRGTIGRKMGFLGELDNVQLKPPKDPIKPKDGIKDCKFIQNPKNEGIKPLGLVRFYPNPYGLRGIEGVSIYNKSKSPPIRINPLQSIWIENNRTSP